MLYYYNPSGRYAAGNVILSPAAIQQMQIKDPHSRTNHSQLIIDRTLFIYSKEGRLQQKLVGFDEYQKFYDFVSGDKSLEEKPEELERPYQRERKGVLTTFIKDSLKGEKSTPFQIIEFGDEDHYRVKLHDSHEIEEHGMWAYFYHTGLENRIAGFYES